MTLVKRRAGKRRDVPWEDFGGLREEMRAVREGLEAIAIRSAAAGLDTSEANKLLARMKAIEEGLK